MTDEKRLDIIEKIVREIYLAFEFIALEDECKRIEELLDQLTADRLLGE